MKLIYELHVETQELHSLLERALLEAVSSEPPYDDAGRQVIVDSIERHLRRAGERDWQIQFGQLTAVDRRQRRMRISICVPATQ